MQDFQFSLIEKNDPEKLEDYLSKPETKFDIRNKASETPLMVAVILGFVSVIEVLLKHTPVINSTNKVGNTALHIAVINGVYKIVEQLVTGGADINIKNHDGGTALHLAVIHGFIDISKLLIIQRDTNLNIQCAWGGTPLMIAAWNGHDEIVRHLLSYGANPSIRCQNDKSALDYAIQYEQINCRDLIRNAWELREKQILVERTEKSSSSTASIPIPQSISNSSNNRKEFNDKELEEFHLQMEAKANGLSIDLVKQWRQVNIDYKVYLTAQELKVVISLMNDAKASKDFSVLKTLKPKRDALSEIAKSPLTLHDLRSHLTALMDALQVHYNELVDKDEDYDAAQKCDVVMTAVDQMKLSLPSS